MQITYKEFKRMDIRIGLIKECEPIPKSSNLLKMIVDCGENQPRQIVAGMAQFYNQEELIGKKVAVLMNLEPKKLMGVLSMGMILAADVENKPYLLTLEEPKKEFVPPGSKIR
jgi:methionine--tRNA ligase beta chain